AAALDKLGKSPDDKVPGGQAYEVNGFTLKNENLSSCVPGSDKATLRQALENSCNTSFGPLAVEAGEDAMRTQAEKFGFGQDYLDGIATEESRFDSSATPDMSD